MSLLSWARKEHKRMIALGQPLTEDIDGQDAYSLINMVNGEFSGVVATGVLTIGANEMRLDGNEISNPLGTSIAFPEDSVHIGALNLAGSSITDQTGTISFGDENLITTGRLTAAGLTLSDMTPGSVIFAGIGGVLSQDNSNLFWDDTNKRLGIGTDSPGRHLHLRKANPVFRFDDSSGTTVTDSVGFIEFGSYNPSWNRHGWIGYGSSIDDALTINNEDGSNIALMGGNVGIGTKAPETLSEWEGTAPYLTIHNSTHEDTDGGGESRLIYKREDGAGTETACFQFEASHDGPGVNDQLGKGVWSVNTGAGLVQALEIGSDLLATFGGAVSIPTGDLTVNTNTLFVDASENAVGIGAAPISAATLKVGGTDTASHIGIQALPILEPGSADQTLIGIDFKAQVQDSAEDMSYIISANAAVNITNTYSGTIGYVNCLRAWGTTSGGTVTDWKGIEFVQPFLGGAVTNCYGLYLGIATKGTTINRAIYSAGGDSVHAGNFTFGATTAPAHEVMIDGALCLLERSSDPTEPTEGQTIIWMSDGTGKGDDGDVMIASKAGGTTNYGTIFDHSGGAGW